MDSADRHASDDRKTGTQGWDPVAALPEGEPEGSFHGQWQNRSGLNVPGPFYTAGRGRRLDRARIRTPARALRRPVGGIRRVRVPAAEDPG